jgi:hypothetical protein
MGKGNPQNENECGLEWRPLKDVQGESKENIEGLNVEILKR